MLKKLLLASLVAALALPVVAQESPQSLVATYDALADAILGVREMEANLVRALVETHYAHAEAAAKRGDWEVAAAEMALVANEGDNAVAGIRKRLVEGGHHHHATSEDEGMYDDGFVIVTREGRKKMLAAVAAMQQATSDAEGKAAFKDFATVVKGLLEPEMM